MHWRDVNPYLDVVLPVQVALFATIAVVVIAFDAPKAVYPPACRGGDRPFATH